MSQINDGGPAFPELVPPANSSITLNVASGMSLRDYFAGQVLAGLMAGDYLKSIIKTAINEGIHTGEIIPMTCYMYADAMIKQRTKNTETK